MSDQQMPLTTHLEELRRKLIIAGVSWLVAFLAWSSSRQPNPFLLT
jgi:sec-independent protein translocase protein TatC